MSRPWTHGLLRADCGILAGIAALAAVLALAGCTTGTVELPDGTRAEFTRLWTATSLEVSEHGLRYSSDPSAAAQQATIEGLLRALVGTALPARLESPPEPVRAAR